MLKLSNIRIPVRIAVACLLPLLAFTVFAVKDVARTTLNSKDDTAIAAVAGSGADDCECRARVAAGAWSHCRIHRLARRVAGDRDAQSAAADRQGARGLGSARRRVRKILSRDKVCKQPRYCQEAAGRASQDALGDRWQHHRQPEGDGGHGLRGRGPSQRRRCNRRHDRERTDHPSGQCDGRADAAQGILGARPRLGNDRLRIRPIHPADVSGVHAQPESRGRFRHHLRTGRDAGPDRLREQRDQRVRHGTPC